MYDYLPSITVQKGFLTNNFYNHKRYFSFGNIKKNIYQNNQNSGVKQKPNSLIKDHNFLIVSNTNKDEVNSNKNTTSITYYNRGFSDKKLYNNKVNIISEKIYKHQNKDSKKNQLANFLLKSYNNNKIIQGINNNINKNSSLRNFGLLLPEVLTEYKNGQNQKGNSLSVSNKENNSNDLNITNSLFNIKQIKNINNNYSKIKS